MSYNKIIIKQCEQNETIYKFLKKNGFSENYIRHLRKREGYIKLNGQTAFTNKLINNGDLLELYKNPATTNMVAYNTTPLDIVYEDDDVLIVNKPSGIPTTPSRSHFIDNLSSMISYYMSKKDKEFIVRIINRLDKDTAGLVCIAKHSLISNLLNSGNYIQKTYYAICTGFIKDNLLIDKPIITTTNELGINNQKREISELGKPARTFVTPLMFDGNNSFCKINLEYGRTHQIRVHLSNISHALVGDELYGKKSELISHAALVCAKMTIINPLTNKKIEIGIDLPNDFKKIFNLPISI